ncbi:hypothetical protein [Legionella maioricensis]|uniref:Phasin protein n=1 Tax=Legionella maioricensis TaxID=2896528 RepID=A0A9X2D235_9GAMM|nr:hypothetical protein [Legionella maioricensis]MCL9684342.1 hypothetical protein [Legionella maioricensis]MCL9688770.1 hypothetical protein [Legionella maioricensis]
MPNQYTQYQNMNALEKPFRQLLDLNVKTMQSFSYIKPNELLNSNRPELVLEKNMEVMIENGHKALDYVQDMFDIMENHWLNMSRQMMRQSQETISQTQRAAQNNMNDLRKAGTRVANSVTGHLKESTKQRSKSAHPATKHSKNKATGSPNASHRVSTHSTQASSANRSSSSRKTGTNTRLNTNADQRSQ